MSQQQRILLQGDLPEIHVQSLCQADPFEKEMAIHSSILAWDNPRTEEPGRHTTEQLNINKNEEETTWRWMP